MMQQRTAVYMRQAKEGAIIDFSHVKDVSMTK